MIDILTTPSMAKPKQDYSRTPGQLLSLISSLGFVSNFHCLWSTSLFWFTYDLKCNNRSDMAILASLLAAGSMTYYMFPVPWSCDYLGLYFKLLAISGSSKKFGECAWLSSSANIIKNVWSYSLNPGHFVQAPSTFNYTSSCLIVYACWNENARAQFESIIWQSAGIGFSFTYGPKGKYPSFN